MSFFKIIQSGRIVETYEYSKSLSPRLGQNARKPRDMTVVRYHRRKDNVSRLTTEFRRLVYANMVKTAPFFVTLTFAESPTIQEGYAMLTKFHQKLRYHYGNSFSFIAVPEFGRKGTKRLHFHVLYWDLPSTMLFERQTRVLASHWGHGWVDCIATDGSTKLGSYLAKYVFKSINDTRFLKQKLYVCARNVFRPVVFLNRDYYNGWGDFKQGWNTDFVLSYMIDGMVVAKTQQYDTLWLGRCYYHLYQ